MTEEFLLFLIIVLLVIAGAIFYRVFARDWELVNGGIAPIVGAAFTGGSKRLKKNIIRVKNLKEHPRSKAEAAVIQCIESATGQKFPTVYVDWLTWRGRQLELDGYNEKLNLAVEVQGPWHKKWIQADENYDKYYERLVRDVVKRRLCRKHGVRLLTIDVTLSQQHWRTYIMSRLYDFEILADKPPNYIAEQHIDPFRNLQIENEMMLGEIHLAEKL